MKQFKVFIKEIPNTYITRKVKEQEFTIKADTATDAKQEALCAFGDYSKVVSCVEVGKVSTTRTNEEVEAFAGQNKACALRLKSEEDMAYYLAKHYAYKALYAARMQRDPFGSWEAQCAAENMYRSTGSYPVGYNRYAYDYKE